MGKSFREQSSPEELGQTLDALAIGISLNPKYVTVRARHITYKHQPLKSVKGAIMCINKSKQPIVFFRFYILKAEKYSPN